ncbi:hypothetical protein [Metabacillus malikii]|uniref:DUF3953 domain-containing protein n=1 Tax=Metabacillus malikii TaxID=1504265 RepID=A0ABT9ZDR5_9BACI|nr:hypothetical protein [Metabacillus malikii]MDQ0229987.1 hypothetical protein [Metabacillus malikii]
MKLLLWAIVLIGTLYSFGHAYVLMKDKNKLGAFGMSIVGCSIFILSFLVQMK